VRTNDAIDAHGPKTPVTGTWRRVKRNAARGSLPEYELVDTSQTPAKLLRTVSYTYYDTGDASNITTIIGTVTHFSWHALVARLS
jgi:hypothetical protein